MMIVIVGLLVLGALAGVLAYLINRDRDLRGIRITNAEVRREDVTPSLPDSWMQSFYERDGQ